MSFLFPMRVDVASRLFEADQCEGTQMHCKECETKEDLKKKTNRASAHSSFSLSALSLSISLYIYTYL
jgi:hypothetical protein